MESLRRSFRPEFLNRIDDVIMFRNLTPELIGGIVELQIAALQKTLGQKDLKIEVGPEVLRELAREGYDPVYGARPLKRLLQKKIHDRLALLFLSGKIRPGDTVIVRREAGSGELEFSPTVAVQEA
ncbi:MAG: hypothetical protein FJW35_16980 [Acidobacteria bacterium]|nr:hypothetical protein [Acidobacteriota bacterium]